MKRTRVSYFKAISGAALPGIGGSPGSSSYVFDGFVCSSGQAGGGGIVDRMYRVDGAIRVFKRDSAGKSHRCFGTIPAPGGERPVVGDFIDIPIHMVRGVVCYEEEAADETQDPPAAKPSQQQGQQRR